MTNPETLKESVVVLRELHN